MAQEPNPLDESLQKFLAGSKKTPEIGYDPGATNPAAPSSLPVAAFRPAVSDIVNVNQNPGKMYTEPELWANELAKAKLAQDTLEQNRQYELKSKAAGMENLMASLQLQDYLKSRSSGVLRRYPGTGSGSRPSSGVRPQFTQVSSSRVPGLFERNTGYQDMPKYVNGVPAVWVGPGANNMQQVNAMMQRVAREGREAPLVLQKPKPFYGR